MAIRTQHTKLLIAQALFCMSLISLSACSEPQQSSQPDPNRVEHRIDSSYPESERRFDVQLPKGYFENSGESFPVLFHVAFDREALEWTQETVQELTSSGQIPEMIIVSLHHDRSNRDDIRPTIKGAKRSGGAELFLDHIEEEIIPILNAEYRVTDDLILAGWSRFGSFTTFALTHDPELFSGYIARSNAGAITSEFLQSNMKNMMSQSPELSSVFHLSIGTKGNEGDRREDFDGLESMLTQTAPSKFRWDTNVIEGAGHSETFQPGLRSGLLFYFSE